MEFEVPAEFLVTFKPNQPTQLDLRNYKSVSLLKALEIS
jgi:hypothetical protein